MNERTNERTKWMNDWMKTADWSLQSATVTERLSSFFERSKILNNFPNKLFKLLFALIHRLYIQFTAVSYFDCGFRFFKNNKWSLRSLKKINRQKQKWVIFAADLPPKVVRCAVSVSAVQINPLRYSSPVASAAVGTRAGLWRWGRRCGLYKHRPT